MKPSPHSLPRVVGSLAYVLLLHVAYVRVVAPDFWYLGFRARAVELVPYGTTLGFIAILALTLPAKLRRPSDFLLWATFILTVAPAMATSHFADIIPTETAFRLSATLGSCFLIAVVLVRRGPRFTLRIRVSPNLVWAVIGVFSITTYGYLALTTGLQLRLTSLATVSDFRFEYREQVAAVGPAIAYLVTAQGYVINPLIMVRGLFRAQPHLVLLSMLGQLLIFSLTGYKMVVLAVPAAILLAITFRRGSRMRGDRLLFGIVGITAVALAIDAFAGTRQLTLIFVNRLLLVPAALTSAYVAVFIDREKGLWGYSALSGITDYPYQKPPNFLVGALFIGDPAVSANANFFADGYANYGYFGMLIETLVFALLLWTVDGAFRYVPMRVTCVILLLPVIALANSSVFTSITTHGFALAILLGTVLPRTGWAATRRSSPDPQPEMRLSMSSS